MPSAPSSQFNKTFCATVKALRERKGITQLQMAAALGTSLENYRKYENRTPLPHRFIPAFCLVIGINESDLFATVSRTITAPKKRNPAAA
jgi:transcriptional regulator with XRE-family HTH domain